MRLNARASTTKGLAIASTIVLLLPVLVVQGCRPSQETIVQAAGENYDFGAKRPPHDTTINTFAGESVPDSLAPDTIFIESMTLKRSAQSNPFYTLIARIQSNKDYRPIGIRRGDNFLWRDIFGKKWITTSASTLPHGLDHHRPLDWHAPRPHDPVLLRVRTNSIAFVVCLDDCSSGHCSYF